MGTIHTLKDKLGIKSINKHLAASWAQIFISNNFYFYFYFYFILGYDASWKKKKLIGAKNGEWFWSLEWLF